MITTETFYGLKCDRCGELFENGEYSFWADEDCAMENAFEEEWNELNGRHYCPNCHEINEETDEIKVYEEYPKHLKTLNGFIDKILHGYNRGVCEYHEYFLVKCKFHDKQRLEEFEANYIKSLLGDKFISLDYEIWQYNNATCSIKFNV